MRNLIRRFVEVGVPGYHIEDQKPGVKKCGHQGGKVLVSENEQIQRLNAARFQLDVMQVPGIIVARTDAEAANLLDGCADERDQPFILGVTNLVVPSYKAVFLALHRKFFDAGRGRSSRPPDVCHGRRPSTPTADAWLETTGLLPQIARKHRRRTGRTPTWCSTPCSTRSSGNSWTHGRKRPNCETYAQAVAEAIAFRISRGRALGSHAGASGWASPSMLSWYEAREKAAALGIDVNWNAERAKTPEGYYQVQGGIEYAIAKSLAAAPFADILWMETSNG